MWNWLAAREVVFNRATTRSTRDHTWLVEMLNRTVLHLAVTLRRKTAANATIVLMYSGTPTRDSRIEGSSRIMERTAIADVMAMLACSLRCGDNDWMLLWEAPRSARE